LNTLRGSNSQKQQVVSRHGPSRRNDHERIGEDRAHRDQREKIELHLDLHRALPEMHEEPAHEHGGHPMHHRGPALSHRS
jgi:hypothetical protein